MKNLKKLLISSLVILSILFGIKVFASTIPIAPAIFDTSLTSAISTSDTTMTLANGTLISGATLTGYACFTVDVGNPNMEFICGTAAGTSVTSLIRGIDPLDGKTSDVGLIYSHRRGADVKITDFPVFSIVRNIINGNDTLPNIISYGSAPSFTTGNQIVTKTYADGLISGGTAVSGTSIITNDTTTNATMFPVWVNGTGGNFPLKVSSTKLFFNPSTGNLSASALTLGGATPSSFLTLPAGTASAGTSPLKFTSGTLLGTTEAGAIEYNGTHLFFTASNGGIRFQLDQQSSASGITVGTSPITGGSNGKIEFNNSGVLGEYAISGTGNVAMTTSPVFTTPNIGVATGSVSGNAGTATALATPRTINGVSFDGSANISVPSNIVPGTSGNLLTSNGTTWESDAPGAIANASYSVFGTVKGLTDAATSGLTISSGVISVNSGTSANNIVKLDGSSKLPAVDGSALTNLPVQGTVVAGSTTGTVLDNTNPSATTITHNLGVVPRMIRIWAIRTSQISGSYGFAKITNGTINVQQTLIGGSAVFGTGIAIFGSSGTFGIGTLSGVTSTQMIITFPGTGFGAYIPGGVITYLWEVYA